MFIKKNNGMRVKPVYFDN